MKNPLRAGLQALIPNRSVKDPDEVFDDDFEDDTTVDDDVSEEPSDADDATDEPPATEEGVRQEQTVTEEIDEPQTEPEAPLDEPFMAPPKPNVTPLTFDEDMHEVLAEADITVTAQQKVSPIKKMAARKTVASSELQTKATVPGAREPASVVLSGSGHIWDKHEEEVLHIPVQDISVNANQPRRKFTQVEMGELISSIAHHGILQPLVVRRVDDGYELVAGERRLRAAITLEWDSVPCVVRRDVTSGASMLELALIENIQRQDLNPVEEAMAYKQLNEEYGMTHEEIGERVGRSRVGVTNVIRILQLPEEIQRGLIEDKIAIGHAKAILMIPDEEKQVRFYRHLVEEGLTVRKAETRARRIQRTMNLDDPMRQKRKGRSAFEVKYSGLLEDRYGYDSKLKFNETKNRYEVLFKCHSKEEIDELLGRLMGTATLPLEGMDRDVIDGDDDEE